MTKSVASVAVRPGWEVRIPSLPKILLGQVVLLGSFLALWELGVRVGYLPAYLYGQPSGVFVKGSEMIASGKLFSDTFITASEAILGFIAGTLLGSIIGLGLWMLPTTSAVLKPFVIALNGLPKIALAPLIIVWFGIGIESKIALAGFITFIVALIAAQQGSQMVDSDLVKLMRSLGASRFKTWRTVIIPGAMAWIISAFRLNVGFSLIGAVVGEYIASEAGLGYMIGYAGMLYDLNSVWVGIAALMVVALLMYAAVDLLEKLVGTRTN